MSDSPPSWTRLVLLILVILISIESPFRSSTDIRRFATVQRTAYGVQDTRVGERSAHLRMAVRALSLFASVPLRRDLQFSFSFFLFLFSFLFFFPRASAANWSQRRHGVSSVLPFSSCACRRPSRSALVLQHGRPRRRMVTRATNATRRAIPQAILRSRTFLLSLFFAVCARSLCRPNEPDWLRAFDFTTAETKAASRRLPIERFRPILLNIIASGTTTIYLFPRCIAAEVAISWYRACTRSFDTSSFVLLLGNDLTKDRDATSSLDESRLESLS